MGFAVVWRLHMHQRRLLLSFDHGLKHIKVHCEAKVSFQQLALSTPMNDPKSNPPAEKQNPNWTCRFITQKNIQKITSTHAQQSSQKNHLRIHHFRCCHVQFHCFTTFKAIESQDWGYVKFCREAEVIFQTTRCWIVVSAIEEGMIWNAIGAIF